MLHTGNFVHTQTLKNYYLEGTLVVRVV